MSEIVKKPNWKANLVETAAENINRSSIYGRQEIRDMLLEYAALLRAPVAVDDAMVVRAIKAYHDGMDTTHNRMKRALSAALAAEVG